MRLPLPALALAAVSTVLFAQQPPCAAQTPASIEAATASQPSAEQPPMKELHIDQNCQAVLEDATGSYPVDPAKGVCHIEGAKTTHRDESRPDGNRGLHGVHVTVAEETYVLQNFADERVTFLVHHPLRDGWWIDSDPKPVTTEDGIAVFRTYADPGETIHLHVGERLEEAADTQPVAPAPPAETQQPAAPPDQDPALQEVNIDQSCRILVQDRNHPAGDFSHPHYRRDESICDLQSVHNSSDYEEQLDNGVLKRTKFHVYEATFVLHNITPDPVAFIVHQPIFNGGKIDSDPQPTTIDGNIAIFRVYAHPGETIKLHVGQRR
jgi:hypothetical protein